MIVPAAVPTFAAGVAPTFGQLTALGQAMNLAINPPRVQAYEQTTNQSLTSATYTALTFSAETFDSDGMHSTATNTSRFTCVTAGTYRFHGFLTFAAGNTTGSRFARWYKNGAAFAPVPLFNASAQAQVVGINADAFIPMAVGDYVELMAYQSSGAALNVQNTGGFGSFCEAIWVSS